MGKQVRAFNLDNEVGAGIDAEAGPEGNKSALVNELLKEALEARKKQRFVRKVTVQFAEATSTLMVFVFIIGLFISLV